MGTQPLRLITENLVQPPSEANRQPLGRTLVDRGVITTDELASALQTQMTARAPLGEILVSNGWASEKDILAALALQSGMHRVDPIAHPPEASLCDKVGAEFCFKHRLVPWLRLGPTVLVATANPATFIGIRPALDAIFGHTAPVLAGEGQIEKALAGVFRDNLALAASTRLADQYSCRGWRLGSRVQLTLFLALLVAALAFVPTVAVFLLSVVALTTLAAFALLKGISVIAHLLTYRDHMNTLLPARIHRRPKISMLVPLYREREIAAALIRRIEAVRYPRALLDVVLVIESEDDITRAAISRIRLPAWMRVVEVPPHGGLTTKPRAMNYALDFCRGDIIGIWDAEDAPETDQLERVAARFAQAPDDVACLQGVLDYYNPRANWIARCFTIEYAAWFRVVLQGIAAMGLVVPLGGTTLFCRRDALERLGGWDAHNVTEDADLGVRLARAGLKTEMLPTTTYEEANCRPWRWVKQRSRWLKGFMVTYLVHMRAPGQLLRDLGPFRFLGFQAFFLGTLFQFLLAPLLWSFWLILLGLPHPVAGIVSTPVLTGMVAVMVATEILTIGIGMIGAARSGRRDLVKWALTLPLYFPLGALASYKALYELVCAPFYWDKTQHGVSSAEDLPTPTDTKPDDRGETKISLDLPFRGKIS